MESKTYILDYVAQNFATFQTSPFNEIDALVLSQASYLDFEGLIPKLADHVEGVELWSLYRAEKFKSMTVKTINAHLNVELIKVLCASPRFRGLKLNFYENIYDIQTEEQFSAVTFFLPTQEIAVAFRGTDLTVTGWKEDFNMFLTSPVPSQVSAVAYLEEIHEKTRGTMILMGHSKGGNLAVYGSRFSSPAVKERISLVYDFDGPGFPPVVLESENFQNDQRKVIKMIPEGSVVGILFETTVEPLIVKSKNLGPLQHDPFSWRCEKNRFVLSEKYSNYTKHLDETVNKWVYELDIEQRKVLIDTIFSLLTAMEMESLENFDKNIMKERDNILKAIREVDEDVAKQIKEMMKGFIRISLENSVGIREEKRKNTLLKSFFKE